MPALTRTRYRLPEKLPAPNRVETRSPEKPSFDGYVRVSYLGHRAGPRFISARQQEAMIRAYAAAHSYVLGRVFVELNRSGTDEFREQLQEALGRVERGESAGIIVARFDRFSRSVTTALKAFSRIEAAGGSLISIEDGLNLRTPFGRALSIVLLALAELEVARIAESTRISRSRMVMRGVHQGYQLPGYLTGTDGRLQPDPQLAPLIVEAFERRAAGATYSEVTRFLRQAEVVGASEGARDWSAKRVYRMLQNPAYLGEAFAGRTRNTDAHPPLVRRGLWLAALAASTSSRANAHGTTLLAGLVRCAGCCHVLGSNRGSSENGRKPGARIYRCRRQHRVGLCQQPASAKAAQLDDAVVELFLQQLGNRRPSGNLESTLRSAEQHLKTVEARAQSHPGWRSAFTDADGAGVAGARAEVLRLWRQRELAELPPAGELRRQWPHMSLTDKRLILSTGLESVILSQGPEPPEERIRLLFAGACRDWFPKPGVAHALRPFAATVDRGSAAPELEDRPA